MKELFIQVLDWLGLAKWVEIITDNPRCTYYFGPFLSKTEAEAMQMGYVEDLEAEGARIVSLTVKKCRPTSLTIFEEREEGKVLKPLVTLGTSVS
jgi:hypothetical protein